MHVSCGLSYDNSDIHQHPSDSCVLLAVAPYYGQLLETVAALFDSMYVSFYKGLAGPYPTLISSAPWLIITQP